MSKDLKGRRIAFLTLIVIVAVGGLIYINNKYLSDSEVRVSGNKGLSVVSELEAASNNSDIFYCLGDHVIEAQGTVIRARKVTGEQAWSMSLGGVIKSVKASGNALLVLDDKNKLYYMNKQGKIMWDCTLQAELWDIYGEDNGCVLIEYKDSEGSKIEVFDSTGTSLGKTTLKNAYIIAFAADKKNNYTLSVLDITAQNLKSRLITYNATGQIVWAKDFKDEIITYVHFLKSNNVLASGTSKLFSYNGDGTLTKELKLDGKITNIAASEDSIAVVINEKGNPRSVILDGYLEVYDNIKLEIVPEGIFVYENNYILYNKDKLMLGNVNDSTVTIYKAVSDIVSAYLTSGDSIYIVSNRKLKALEFN